MAGSVRAALLGLLLQILYKGLAAQQLLLARPQRSLFEAPLGQVEQVEHLPPLGWNSVGAGLGVGEWGYSPVGLGHMSKDELLTLLEAWKEVEQESAATTTAPPADTTTRRPAPPAPPPPPPAPPRPIPMPVSIAMPAPPLPSFPQPPSGTPITVRLPAFVPVRLAAVFTPPAGGQTGSAAPSANGVREAGGDDLATDDVPDDGVSSRLFRFIPMAGVRTRPPSNPQARQQFVVRNTLDSVDAGTAPVRQQVKPEVQPKAHPSIPKFPGHPPAPFFRPRFGVPPSLANARFELVPSSQIIGDWRE
ncbi:vegetative cell wall protein gp1 [Drosophila erecta]|uniref:DUF4794 domain-containing protein n=1 Tax=Drosophila erecta TaxID=7220 RepID=B3P9A6_DROER|nr:vegetative cell wall protein gp1 [Drosophila erecta]EDV45402.2 uncharacterized protein Dere_GG12740 [Drosophila erecta]